jgi:hypothetical protein
MERSVRSFSRKKSRARPALSHPEAGRFILKPKMVDAMPRYQAGLKTRPPVIWLNITLPKRHNALAGRIAAV